MFQNNVTPNRVEAEYADHVLKNSWTLLYQKIGMECQLFRYTCNEAKKPENRPLNRYRDVNPFDHTRVLLRDCETDYINANFVTMEHANRRYILTQGPLAFTVGHFWKMIWQQNTKAILMLNKVIEKNEVKCHMYWPQEVGEEHTVTFDDVNMTVTLTREDDCVFFSIRTFRVYHSETDVTKFIKQYHYTTWPDFGVPTSPDEFLRFLKCVRDSGALDPTDGPPVIHCSAGIGRSGTFCLVDCCLVLVEKDGIDNLDIEQVLLDLRRQRMGLIQTPDQLTFTYQAVIEGTKRLDPNYVIPDPPKKESAKKKSLEEEAPPPPPPRGESLTKPPARPLPAIPASESLGNLDIPVLHESSSDESAPTPTGRASASSSADEATATVNTITESIGEATDTLRQRRNRELAERVSDMKKRDREAERWHAIKRSLFKPLTITFGFLLAGIIIYAYVK